MKLSRFVRAIAGLAIIAGAGLVNPSSARAQPADNAGTAGRHERFQPRPQGPLDVDRLVRLMEEKLDLSDDQASQIQDIVQEYRDRLEEEKSKQQASLEDQKETLRQLIQEQMEAREAGDQERLKEIRDEIRQLRPKNAREHLERELISNIEEVLNETQREQFRTLLTRMRDPATDPELLRTNPSLLRRAVSRLGLDEDQRTQVNDLFREYWQQMRDADPTDQEARERLAVDFHDRVMQLLTEDQAKRLETGALEQPPQMKTAPAEPPTETEADDQEQQEEGDY